MKRISGRAQKLLAKAEATNARRDAMDRANGFGSPLDGPAEVTYQTVISALVAGLQTGDWDCVAEGTAILGSFVGYTPWREGGVTS